MKDTEVRKAGEHYEIYIDGAFYCSCDNITEVMNELDRKEDDA